MRIRRPLIALVAVALVTSACSGDDDAAPGSDTASEPSAEPSTATSAPTPIEDDPDAPAVTAGLPVTTLGADAPSSATAAPDIDTGSTESQATATEPAPATVAETVPEEGIPGLDSDDLFCAAWSRFGGTWQVLLVGSTFLDDPARVARWEVSSAPLVVGAYTELLAQLPDELETERDALAEGYFGALERRARDARDALVGSGANGSDIAGLSEAWLAALETRDPSTPEVAFVEPDALVGLVDVASADLAARRTEFHLDPSLIVTVETPLTDAYLESNCPDQGTLAGGEIDG